MNQRIHIDSLERHVEGLLIGAICYMSASIHLFVGVLAYQCIGSSNFEGNTVAYLKCFTEVIKINNDYIQHYSDNILNSNQSMSTTHTFFI